jgi:hypothetical protein
MRGIEQVTTRARRPQPGTVAAITAAYMFPKRRPRPVDVAREVRRLAKVAR